MGRKIVIVGAGAVGGYAGAHMVQAGEDVTFIDPWPAHVEHMRKHGLKVTHAMQEPEFTVPVRALHVTDAQQLSKEKPVDIAFVCMKSYDTAWATMLIRQYLAPDGYVVSLQNCLNEETIAGIVGWGRTVGVVSSFISVDLHEVGRIRRTVPKGGEKHTVFRIGEPHGRITARVEELVQWFRGIDSAKATTNLWGERWSKLVQNAMGNPITAATGMTSPACLADPVIRRFALQVAGEGVRVGQALGYQLEKIRGIDPATLARAGGRDDKALAEAEKILLPKPGSNPRGDIQRPSMAQDILKGRRTEIEAMNGFIARKGAELGIRAPANAKITELVTRIERGELKPSPSHLGA